MTSTYHEGELEVQARAGVRQMAERVGRGIHPTVPPIAQAFLRQQPMAVVGSVGESGRVWASQLTGRPGFLSAPDARTVRVEALPSAGDPLASNLKTDARLGLLVIEPATRRRMRVNGHVAGQDERGFDLRTEQVYSNCPKYIQARTWRSEEAAPQAAREIKRGTHLTPWQQNLIREADTFFIATAHPEAGVDVSHRGGMPGFVRVVDGGTLEWGDYQGNSMFQTLGNITASPHAGLLFIDFEGGTTLHLTGRAQVIWEAERAAEFAGAERVVQFQADEIIEMVGATPLRWRLDEYSPFNPS